MKEQQTDSDRYAVYTQLKQLPPSFFLS